MHKKRENKNEYNARISYYERNGLIKMILTNGSKNEI